MIGGQPAVGGHDGRRLDSGEWSAEQGGSPDALTFMKEAVFLFPGQGSQEPGMGKALVEAFPAAAAALVERSRTIVGGEFLNRLFGADQEELRETRIAQPAVFLASMAAAEALRSLGVNPSGAAGHSLGEYSALVAAQVLTFEDGLRIVLERARLMAERAVRVKGGMAAIIGLKIEDLRRLVEETARTCPVEIANINSPDQIVVSGKEECVETFAAIALERGAKRTVRLEVSGAFHSALMSPVSEQLARLFEQYEFSAPRVPLVCNVTGDFVSDPVEIKRLLAEQVCSPVQWHASMNRFVDAGFSLFVEVGPGRVLKGLMKRISRSETRVLSAGEPDAVRKTAQELLDSERNARVPAT